MKLKLAESFKVVLKKIIATGCVVIDVRNGWYHSYNKRIIKDRIAEIKAEIYRLETPANP